MELLEHIFTSESVTEGHPDKVADQISDAVLDALLALDPQAHVACETLVTTGHIIIAGEITAHGAETVDLAALARQTVAEIGYTAATGFDPGAVTVHNLVQAQSPEIGQGVASGGAGDQGMMFGFACTETPELMPAPIAWAHRLARQLAQVRRDGTLPYLRPDGKSQVTVAYAGHRPTRIDQILLSSHHAPEVSLTELRADLVAQVLAPVLAPLGIPWADATVHLNPAGAFTVGGPVADTGLTGRKIIVDTYGGMGRQGGGAFSGKDPTKVDRSAAYMMRYIAKNLVAAGVAERLEVEVAYAIGEAAPVSIGVETFGTGVVPEAALVALVREHFDLTPRGISETLALARPQYRPTAAYGHFGRTDLGVRWEETDRAEALARQVGTIPFEAGLTYARA